MGCIQSCFSSANQATPTGQRSCRALRCCGSMPIEPERRYRVTGCTYLHNGYLVIVDHNNKRIKLYTPELKCCSFIVLEYRPFGICADGNSIYVTMPKKKMIQRLKVTIPMPFVSRKLLEGSFFPTEAECRGIASYNGDLIVSLKYSTHANTEITDTAWQIQIVSTKGTVKRRIIHDQSGLALVQDARFICLTADKKELVISEGEDNRVKCLNIETGELTFNQHLEDPKGVVCDDEGNIYVLGKHGAIRWILYDRSVVKSLLQGTPSVNFSDALAYWKNSNALAVPRNENKIDFYRLQKSMFD